MRRLSWERRMRPRTALPLLLLVGCAQVPTGSEESFVDADQRAEPRVVAVAPAALAPSTQQSAVSPRAPGEARPGSAPLPKLRPAGDLVARADAAQKAAEAPSKSLWPRITRGFAMQPLENDQLVREWESWYANRPEYVARMINRSSHFLFHIVEEIEKRNMPL